MIDVSYRFGAGRYIQDEDVLEHSGEEILRYGKKAYILTGKTAYQVTENRMRASFEKAGLTYIVEEYEGYPCKEKIRQLSNTICENNCDVMVGVGGGRIMDTAKAAAFSANIPIVTIPTQAATCAAFSPLSVLYTPEGKSDDYIQFEHEVDSVLVDEQVMITQTPRLLAAGILDAMAKYIEIAALKPYALDADTSIARHSAFYMSEYTYNILKENGTEAMEDLKKGLLTKNFKDVVYINIALTGIVSGMMQGRGQTALGHGFNNAMHKEYLEQIKNWYHGEGVAVGLLAQSVYNEENSKIEELKKIMKAFEMPCSLEDLGVEPCDETVECLYERLRTYGFMTHDDRHEQLLKAALNEIRKS